MNSSSHYLTTNRLILRRWTNADFPAFAKLNADPRVREFFPTCLTEQESTMAAQQIQQNLIQKGFGFWAVEVKNGAPFIGFVGISRPTFEAHFMPCMEIGWRLAHETWGQGYAKEAARAALAFGFEELNLDEIVSFTAIGNTRSIAVMKRLGMTHNSADDFDHPALPLNHPLRPHVLYRLSRS